MVWWSLSFIIWYFYVILVRISDTSMIYKSCLTYLRSTNNRTPSDDFKAGETQLVLWSQRWCVHTPAVGCVLSPSYRVNFLLVVFSFLFSYFYRNFRCTVNGCLPRCPTPWPERGGVEEYLHPSVESLAPPCGEGRLTWHWSCTVSLSPHPDP